MVHPIFLKFDEVYNCTVNVTVYNNVSMDWAALSIVVENPILNMTLHTDSPRPMIKGENQTVLCITITFLGENGKVPPPTNASYIIKFGHQMPWGGPYLDETGNFSITEQTPNKYNHAYYKVRKCTS